ncbi:MAG: phosphate acyltransferase PlsX [Holosporaceae bacterium]|jgi:glycerol-3-phosphate acyltransferase PlsX|nr:phosphate acyltransferase PlsX [Holosporaceae bacterium]
MPNVEGGKTIAVDGMGGDSAPESVFRGLAAVAPADFRFVIFGDEDILKKHAHLLPSSLSYEIRHADVAVAPDDSVLSALRRGKNSGMGMAIGLVQTGEAAAVVSSGNTGLYMALAKIILNTIDGVDRPAIASVIPGRKGPVICLDLGANSECEVKNLVDFAIMGEALARSVFNKSDIRLALLNIGAENVKGSRLVKKTSEILRRLFDNYLGFVEGDYIFNGNADVVVTDGFTGNVALKAIEGTAKYMTTELKESLSSSLLSRVGMLLATPALRKFRKKVDPRLYNGAILLGLKGVVVKSHGNSDGIGFANALRFTMNILNNNIFRRIEEQLEKSKLQRLSEQGEAL